MRNRGPNVIVTCSICGIASPVATTIKDVMLPGSGDPTKQIVVPLVIHCGDGGHLAAHPAMMLEDMGT